MSTDERDRLADQMFGEYSPKCADRPYSQIEVWSVGKDSFKAGYDARDKEVALLRKLTSFARHAAHCVELAPRDCDGDIIECKCGFDKARAALAKGGVE